jgi:multisubunit Na+/H+ antiporter MnhF subunit
MTEALLHGALAFATLATAGAALLILVVLIRGPGTIDRAIALDMLGLVLASLAGLAALHAGHGALVDIAMAIGLIGFFAAIALARLVETHRGLRGDDA